MWRLFSLSMRVYCMWIYKYIHCASATTTVASEHKSDRVCGLRDLTIVVVSTKSIIFFNANWTFCALEWEIWNAKMVVKGQYSNPGWFAASWSSASNSNQRVDASSVVEKRWWAQRHVAEQVQCKLFVCQNVWNSMNWLKSMPALTSRLIFFFRKSNLTWIAWQSWLCIMIRP